MGCFLVGIANRFEMVISGNSVAGVGQAGTHPVSSSIISSKFEVRGIGSALSTFYGLGYVGNIASPVLLSGVAAVMGYRYSYYLLGACFLITASVVFIGLYGETASDRSVSEGSGRSLLQDIRSALKVKGAVPILLAQAFISGGTGMGVMTTWVPVYLRDTPKGLGLPVFDAGVISSVATIGGVLGTIYIGRLADQKGYLRTATYSLAATTVLIFFLIFYHRFTLMIVPHLFLLSMTTFCMSSILQAYLARAAGPNERDILLGLFFTFGFGVSSLWATLLGSLIDYLSFNAVWLTMVGAGLAAQLCLFFASKSRK
jgi:MFS family permease